MFTAEVTVGVTASGSKVTTMETSMVQNKLSQSEREHWVRLMNTHQAEESGKNT